ncbi:hypothetical protein ATK36_3712 [Amycolatopsis sulphurea]|uniref:Uncharacterized protein n=1 Tax=Amycolatopsis sulphurea TaxID=76022 RepID=A0A2A9FDG7_9PSEU|nr:hypothetical protein ATK36_3712 [Amycolatopsis sulphurea]
MKGPFTDSESVKGPFTDPRQVRHTPRGGRDQHESDLVHAFHETGADDLDQYRVGGHSAERPSSVSSSSSTVAAPL